MYPSDILGRGWDSFIHNRLVYQSDEDKLDREIKLAKDTLYGRIEEHPRWDPHALVTEHHEFEEDKPFGSKAHHEFQIRNFVRIAKLAASGARLNYLRARIAHFGHSRWNSIEAAGHVANIVQETHGLLTDSPGKGKRLASNLVSVVGKYEGGLRYGKKRIKTQRRKATRKARKGYKWFQE